MIGLASDRLSSKGYDRPSYEIREHRLIEALESLGCHKYSINEIFGPFPAGLTGQRKDPVSAEVTTIVVSEETAPNALQLNELRRQYGLAPLRIVTVPLLLAADSKPIAARRIAAGEIDAQGSLRPDRASPSRRAA